MKIVFVITDMGSFNNFLSELSLALLKTNGFTLHVICSAEKIIEVPDKFSFLETNIQFHYVPIPRKVSVLKELKVALMIRKLIAEIKPDLVHSHFTTGTFPTILFRNRSLQHWGTFHGLGMNSSTGLLKYIFAVIEFFCFLRLDRIFLINTADITLTQSLYFKNAYKYKSLGLGCDLNKFNPDTISFTQKQSIKKSLGIEKQTVIAFTGRFVFFKGFHVVIKSFLQLIHNYPNRYKLLLIGGFDNSHSSGLTDDELERAFTHPDILNVGYTNQVAQYLSIAHLFVFPSKKEGLPVCILEALAMGIPVITSDTRGNHDIIKDDYNGILINPMLSLNEEINMVENSIHALSLDTEKYSRLQHNAIKDRLQYNRINFINEHLNLYQQFIHQK